MTVHFYLCSRRSLSGFLLFALFALFALLLSSPAQALTAQEEARINALLAALEQRSTLVFIRNGDAHGAAEAAQHLKLKLGRTRDRLQTAEQFIDQVASSSSISGKPYLVREPGKSEQHARDFLHELLRQIALEAVK
ncbi:hypothetical protein AGMMS49543_03090 [Betaproteobacteria bacterium]|nr:hypothetical protein AGMMS49543_03090 [Betaproteobacteria bacterium]GHU22532.1 hypothetical protein AGMMS50243_22300 [Betaproteobacteria bacterium]